MHGGGPPVMAGRPLDHAYKAENVELVRAGCCNLEKHVRNMRAYGVPVVVALNRCVLLYFQLGGFQLFLDLVADRSACRGDSLRRAWTMVL